MANTVATRVGGYLSALARRAFASGSLVRHLSVGRAFVARLFGRLFGRARQLHASLRQLWLELSLRSGELWLGLSLRTKFLLALIVTTFGLTSATLVAVRHVAENHARQQIVADTSSSLAAFQVLFHENDLALKRKADLLATVASMRDGYDPSVLDAGMDPVEEGSSQLTVLADEHSNIKALRTSQPNLDQSVVQKRLANSLRQKNTSDWWYVGGDLYQVVLQPVDRRDGRESAKSDIVVVGRVVNDAMVRDLGRISASQVAFTNGNNLVATTLSVFDRYAFGERLKSLAGPRDIQISGHRFFARSLQLTETPGADVRVTVLKSYSDADAFLAVLNRVHLALVLLGLIASIGIAVVISDKFTRPLANLDKGVQALELGDYSFPLHIEGGDEVAHLTRAFDKMRTTLQRNETQKQQLEDQLRQAQKMEALGRLAGGVAHDFNNLLTIIKGHNDLMMERIDPADSLSKSGGQIRKAADRAAQLTMQMLAFSRRQALQPTIVDLNFVVADMSKLLKRLIREDIEVAICPGETLGRIKADAGQIGQVILNLVVNACDAMPQGGKLAIETQNVIVAASENQLTVKPGRYVVLSVADTGHGMDEETKARLFEPFFTTKPEGKGTGLGLATVYGVVMQSGGSVAVDSAPGRGAKFSIYLPSVGQKAEPARAEKVAVERHGSGELVLLVEDEAEVRALAQEFLASAGYRVITAVDGQEALEIANRQDKRIDLLVTDIVMPRMRGTELAKRLLARNPRLKVVYMSGYVDNDDAAAAFLAGSRFVQKPFSSQALLNHVHVALRAESFSAESSRGRRLPKKTLRPLVEAIPHS